MDLDAILTWHPGLAVVDELAHTNAPGSRHPKRYQDVLELLDAGIDVYTTLNVQHVASRSDTVRQISGVSVHETVPDSVLDLADEIALVDLTPEQLRLRLAEGKVYLGEKRTGRRRISSEKATLPPCAKWRYALSQNMSTAICATSCPRKKSWGRGRVAIGCSSR